MSGMYPSGSSYIPSGQKKGVDISLESFDEWKIQEIGYDGVEKYIRPESFSDHVAKLARQVDWNKLIGEDGVYDNPTLIDDEMSDDDEEKEETSKPKEKVPVEEKPVPDAGPWHGVAKNLHESLLQLNVLLDNLAVMRKTDYMKPLTILAPEAPPLDTISNSKALQWVSKRKALCEAGNVLDLGKNRYIDVDDQEYQQKTAFFDELKKMRQNWRIRKTGEHIYGDLGYHIFGTKYHPRELFDITRRSPSDMVGPNASNCVLQVSVPRDLVRRSTISVTVVKDDPATKNMFASLDDVHFEYINVDNKQVEKLHWNDALTWAQETLICRDTFNSLCSDAVQLRRRLSTVRDGVLIVSLYDDLLLRIELKHHPFDDREIPEEGDAYLTRSLRQMVVAQECTRYVRPQIFVSLPLTNLSEALDSRGPMSFTQKEIESRATKPQLMLEKLIAVSSHYSLVKTVREVLEDFIKARTEPQVHWRWLRCSPTSSQFMVIMNNRNFDFVVGKVTYYIKVTTDSINLVSKDGQVMDCHRDRAQLLYCLKFMTCNFCVTAISSLGKLVWSYQIMHANMNAVDEQGQPAPTLYLTNANANRSILLQFGIDRPPVIKVRKFISELKVKEEDMEKTKFTVLNYVRLRGSTLCKKMDNLFALLRESPDEN